MIRVTGDTLRATFCSGCNGRGFDFSFNQLSGTIPNTIGSLTALT